MYAVRLSPDCARGEFLFSELPAAGFKSFEPETLWALPPALIRELHFPSWIVISHSEIEARTARYRADVQVLRRDIGFADTIGVIAHPQPGVVVVMYAGLDSVAPLARPERERLTRIALHLESAFRLRLRPEARRAVVRPDGRVLHGERGRWPSAVRAIASARDDGDIDLWTALVSGEVSVVARREGTRREYAVLDNAPGRQAMRALTKREVDVLASSARGLSAKMCAYALGLSPATVSTALANAAAKVGVATRVELLRIAALLARDPRSDAAPEALTCAEREIMELLAQGLSNAAIAAHRGRGVRTIANQVAALLRKTGAGSRRALVTRLPNK